MNTITEEISVKSALNKLKRRIPYGWDLNIYRGCSHGCQYCYAMYSHKYLGQCEFSKHIYVKKNIVEVLDKELKAASWKNEIVNIGGVTDSYQLAEKEYQLMPQILKLFIKYKTPVIISTKSSLVLRDIELINQLSKITYVNIASTITTLNEEDRAKIEPYASSSIDRFKILHEFSKTNASTGLHIMPIIPYITDNYENIDNLLYCGAKSNVDYVLCGALYLRGKTRYSFLKFIKEKYPNKYYSIIALYKTGAAPKEYKSQLYSMVSKLRNKYKLSNSYIKKINEARSKGLIG